jgi:F-type H+-transporting ATPase subunit delta
MTYANALFQAGEDTDTTDVIEKDAADVQEVFHREHDFFNVLCDPTIPAAERREILGSVFRGQICQELLNFLCILVDHGRMRQYDRIVGKFLELKEIAYGTVFSVEPLTAEQMGKLQEQMTKVVGSRVQLRNEIDRSLIGGFRILVNGRVFDTSLKKRLADLGASMQV